MKLDDTELNAGLLTLTRVRGDRGTVSIQGTPPPGLEYLAGSLCGHCGNVGHVYYHGNDIVAECRYPDGDGKWYVHATRGLGDSVCECVWCGATFTGRDIWGPERTDADVREFRRQYPKKYGYRVRLDLRMTEGT